MTRLLVCLLISSLVACSTMRENSAVGAETARTGLGDAITAPLEDVNLKREEIPVQLRALRGPYPMRAPADCAGIASHVADLTAVLGPDADTRLSEEDGRLGRFAGEGALDVISDTATDLIPFRSIVRFATGATAHDKKVRRAYQNGIARRAYLKGLGEAKGCDGLAAPDRRR